MSPGRDAVWRDTLFDDASLEDGDPDEDDGAAGEGDARGGEDDPVELEHLPSPAATTAATAAAAAAAGDRWGPDDLFEAGDETVAAAERSRADEKAAARLVEDLTEPQRAAVEHRGGPLLVVAGAGSGKTRVLTRRVAHLMATADAAPWEILAITFTNKAANEMRQRVAELVGRRAQRMWVSTFHSACLRILRAHASRLGYRSSFTIYDETDSRRLIELVVAEHGLDPKRLPPRSVGAVISQAKSELVDFETFKATALDEGDPFRRRIGGVYADYQQRLLAANAMDFDDLLMVAVNLFEACPDVLEHYQQRFTHVLVDEFQDTNRAQDELVRLLGRAHRNVCVVGDADQSIYRWRGAEVRNILEFELAFPDVTVVSLEQNFRSTKTILDAANALIEHNTTRRPKHLWTEGEAGAPITRYRAEDERDEAAWVAREALRQHADDQLPYGQVAVFYRTNAQSRVMEEEFAALGIPYRVIGGTRFYDRREVKDLLAYLRVVANPDDEISARRIVNVPKRGIGSTSVARLTGWALEHRVPFVAALGQAEDVGLSGKAARGAGQLAALLAELRTLSDRVPPAELVQAVADRTGYLEELVAEGTHEADGRIENVGELVDVAAGFEDLAEMLESVALVTDADEVEDDANTVSLMTLHVAKGLEFSSVFLVGMEDGVFPHLRSLGDPAALEEERRLCYVGVTRARRRLSLSHAWSRTMWGSSSQCIPSRFLSEIPSELIEDAGRPTRHGSLGGVGTRPPSLRGAPRRPALLDLAPGDAVVHDRWGDGIVLSTSGEGERLEARVRFAGAGEKRLLVVVAPLQRP